VSQYVEYYFSGEADRPAGEHTRMLRQAYQKVHGEQKKKYTWAIVGALVISMLLGAYAVVQHMRNEQFEEQAAQIFATIKEVDIQVAQLQQLVEEQEDADLATALNEARQRRQRLNEQYSNKVEELGLYREATEREREIYRVARIFRESEFSIPAGFVRRVKDKIENFWLQEPHRSDYVEAIERARENGYIAPIVETMQAHGLPPEFFYLALQESKFLEEAVGPPTRYGKAKGMWQFIPRTAERFGLRVGPRQDTEWCEPQDERCDFQKATAAAARYLRFIYSTKAQASGLLVIASYNWGEHRVVGKLERLPGPQRIPDAALEGIPENPQSRNYWRFLNEYSDRMPEQTKDYVLKIVAAAVIGQNPRLFGFSFDNPLRGHIGRAARPSAVS
jgi:soluble lytic murein transglycosylase-like protein